MFGNKKILTRIQYIAFLPLYVEKCDFSLWKFQNLYGIIRTNTKMEGLIVCGKLRFAESV